MPKVTFVKSARKANPVAKKGESYYWWAFMQGGRGGPKRYSKTPPKPSQLTQSDFWGAVYSVQEAYPETPNFEDIESVIEDIKSEFQTILDDTQGKYDNLPEGLQSGPSGELLQERIDALAEVISALESVDASIDEGERAEGVSDEDHENELEELRDQRAQEIWDEVTSAWEVSCS